jgi:hypothetical protein
MGHEQTSRHVRVMSVIPPKADIRQRGLHVCFVPEADIGGARPACPPVVAFEQLALTDPVGVKS